MQRHHVRPFRIAALAVATTLVTTVLSAAPASAAPSVTGVQFPKCLTKFGCTLQIHGSSMATITSVSTVPALPITITSSTDTLIEISIPANQAEGMYDLVLHDPSGDITFPDELMVAMNQGELAAITPVRVLDTRHVQYGGPIPLAPGGTRTLDADDLDIGGDSSYAASLVLNVTATESAASGYLTVFPGDAARPNASNVNFLEGQTVPNVVSVGLSPDRTFRIFNGSQGTTHVIVDVVGYHLNSLGPGGGRLEPTEPYRAYDSRDDILPFGSAISYVEDVDLGTFPAGTTAVALNVTAVGAVNPGYVTIFPATEPSPPNSSNLNVASAAPVPNMVIVRANESGVISVAASPLLVDLIFDVVGFYRQQMPFEDPLPAFVSTAPERILDTRDGTGAPLGPAVGGHEIVLDAGDAGIPARAEAVLLNVTVTQPTTPGYLSVWPGGVSRPLVSSLNFVPGQTVPNFVLVPIGSDGTIRFLAPTGTVHVIADLAGYYQLP